MKTTEVYRTKEGALAGFQINGAFITRFGVERIIRRFSGVRITKSQRSWRLSRDDDFTHFVLNGGNFVVFEPWGDSDLYHIVAEDPPALAEIERVRNHFERYKRFGGI